MGKPEDDVTLRSNGDKETAFQIAERAASTLAWLQTSVWPFLPEECRGNAPSKEEQEELLGL